MEPASFGGVHHSWGMWSHFEYDPSWNRTKWLSLMAHTTRGEFTVRSAYHFELERRKGNIGTSDQSLNWGLWRRIRTAQFPQKVKSLTWRASSDGLPTMDALGSKGTTSWSYLCTLRRASWNRGPYGFVVHRISVPVAFVTPTPGHNIMESGYQGMVCYDPEQMDREGSLGVGNDAGIAKL